MKDLFIVLGWLVGLIVGGCFIVITVLFISEVRSMCKTMKTNSATKMTYKQIKDLYFVNEKRWKITSDRAGLIKNISYETAFNSYNISVSVIDYIRLQHFLNKLENAKNQHLRDKKLEEILLTAQKDIDARYAEANKCINDAKTILDNVHI